MVAVKVLVMVVGLRIIGPGYGDNMHMRAFFKQPGTTVALLVKSPKGGLIELDRKVSRVATFTDDKGTDMTKSVKRGKWGTKKAGFGAFPKISKDTKACLVELHSPIVPAKGAKIVKAAGTLVFKTATKKKTFKQTGVVLKVGTKIKAGKIPFEIVKTGKPKWGKAKLTITLKTNRDILDIAAIRFLDAADKPIKSTGAGGSAMRMGKNVTVNRSFNLFRKVESVTVAIDYWMDMKVVKVPFSVKTTVGL